MPAAGSDEVIFNVSIGLNTPPAYFSLISFQHHWINLYLIRKIDFQSILECEKSSRASLKRMTIHKRVIEN